MASPLFIGKGRGPAHNRHVTPRNSFKALLLEKWNPSISSLFRFCEQWRFHGAVLVNADTRARELTETARYPARKKALVQCFYEKYCNYSSPSRV